LKSCKVSKSEVYIGVVIVKLRKACVLDKKYSKKSYALKKNSMPPNQSLIIKLKSFG